MENNPKKSKALIITFVIVLLLLIGGYLLYQNSAKIFGTKGATTINKIFSPLLGTSKNTSLDTIDNSNSTSNTTGTNTTSNGTSGTTTGTDTTSGSNFNQSGNNGSDIFTNGGNLNLNSGLNSIPIPSGIDSQNYPSTTINSTSNTGNTDTIPTDTGIINNLDSGTETDSSVCKGQAQLVFTDAETTQINKLLDRYYTIADTIQTEQSLAAVNTDIGSKQSMVDQAKNLTNLCYEEKADSAYTGTKRVTNNPYYQNPSSSSSYYFDRGIEEAFSIW